MPAPRPWPHGDAARVYDLHGRYPLQRSYALVGYGRTGSTLLATALWDTGRGGMPAEYFHPSHITALARRWGVAQPTLGERARARRRGDGRPVHYERWRPGSLPRYVEAVLHHRTGPGGVFGLKLFWSHVQLLEAHGVDAYDALHRPAVVFLTRRDRVALAVSQLKAEQTRAFRSTDRPRGEARYDAAAIARSCAADRGWEAWFARHGVEPLRLRYEDLVDDLPSALERVLAHVGIDPGPCPVPPQRLRRQADDLNQAWIDRFRAEHPDEVPDRG